MYFKTRVCKDLRFFWNKVEGHVEFVDALNRGTLSILRFLKTPKGARWFKENINNRSVANYIDDKGFTPLDTICKHDHSTPILKFILSKFPSLEICGSSHMEICVELEKLESINVLLQFKGLDWEACVNSPIYKVHGTEVKMGLANFLCCGGCKPLNPANTKLMDIYKETVDLVLGKSTTLCVSDYPDLDSYPLGIYAVSSNNLVGIERLCKHPHLFDPHKDPQDMVIKAIENNLFELATHILKRYPSAYVTSKRNLELNPLVMTILILLECLKNKWKTQSLRCWKWLTLHCRLLGEAQQTKNKRILRNVDFKVLSNQIKSGVGPDLLCVIPKDLERHLDQIPGFAY